MVCALDIEEKDILCTSIPGHQLIFGTSIDEQLKTYLNETIGLIALITKDSLRSNWVIFELGSSWAMSKLVVPIMGPGITYEDLPGSLKNYPGVRIEDENPSYRLTDVINQLAETLTIAQKNSAKKEVKKYYFLNQLKAWKSNKIDPYLSLQKQVEELTVKLQDTEKLYNSQLTTNEQEKRQFKTEIENLKQSLEAKIQKAQKQLEQEQAISLQQSEHLKTLQQQLAEKELIIAQLQQQLSPPTIEVELRSERGVDYTLLRDLLVAGKWEEADEETARVMFEAAKRKLGGYLDENDIDNFPCEDLRTINQLWLHYSQGKFGFSVQAEIYRLLGGTREYDQGIWEKFADRVGWRKRGSWLNYDDLTFSINVPKGSFPYSFQKHMVGRYSLGFKTIMGGWFSCLASRLVTCTISPSQTFVNT